MKSILRQTIYLHIHFLILNTGMKKIRINVIFLFLLLSAAFSDSYAQKKDHKKVKTSFKKETGPPPWATAHGYRVKTRYVYNGSGNACQSQ